MQRKKVEAEEKRVRQRKAKEEFMKMLEVRIQLLSVVFLFTVHGSLYFFSYL